MRPVLSICIPTSNRPLFLKKAIESILYQQPFIEGKVEIVVSDNSDSDDSLKVVDKIAKQHKNIRYFRNDENVGALNYSLALSRGTASYRKLSNDTICFNRRSLTDMVYTVENHLEDRPVLLWKIYHRIGKEYVKTRSFEELMHTISYYSTWIASYGIWEDEAEDALEDCKNEKKIYQRRFKKIKANDSTAKKRGEIRVTKIATNPFWNLCFMQKSFRKKGEAIIVDSASNWSGELPYKKYQKGLMKWYFHDYYMDILSGYNERGLISQECVDDLERDVAFSFFVNYMIDFEFPSSNIEYDSTDPFIQDVFREYEDKEYYDDLYNYYQKRREQRIEELKRAGEL